MWVIMTRKFASEKNYQKGIAIDIMIWYHTSRWKADSVVLPPTR